jgi:hypothetical protein
MGHMPVADCHVEVHAPAAIVGFDWLRVQSRHIDAMSKKQVKKQGSDWVFSGLDEKYQADAFFTLFWVLGRLGWDQSPIVANPPAAATFLLAFQP